MAFRRRGRKLPRRRRGLRRRRVMRKPVKRMNRIQSLTIRQPGAIVPDRLFTKLMYFDTDSSTINTGGTFGLRQYNANGAFDPNPLLNSGSTKGFAQLAQLYNRYRVHGCKVYFQVSNQNEFPITMLAYPSNEDLLSLASLANLQSWTMLPYCRHKMLSPVSAGAKGTIKYYMSTKKIMGYKGSKYDDTTAALVTSNPTNAWFWNLGVFSPSNALTLTNSYFDAKVTYYIEFYDRKTISGITAVPDDVVIEDPVTDYPPETIPV